MPILTKPYLVLTAAEIVQGDLRCQQCTQSSTTLAYACLLIRKGDTALAAHILDTLSVEKSTTHREVLGYFRAWLRIEDKDFQRAKSELVTRIHQQPSDLTALSLLQACLLLEQQSGAVISKPLPPTEMQEHKSVEPVVLSRSDTGGRFEVEWQAFTPIVADAQTRAFILWKIMGNTSVVCRDETLRVLAEGSLEWMSGINEPISKLGGGDVQKMCFSFSELTLSTWHHREINAGLFTGPLQPALAVIVRTDKAFHKLDSHT